MVSGVSGATSGSSGITGRSIGEISPEEFLQLLITQLQNQDPFEPVKNQELLQQMSAVRQLQSNIELQSTLEDITLQNQISSAGALIGKVVQGLNAGGDKIGGVVTSVAVEAGKVHLELDTGQRMPLSNVHKVSELDGGAAA